MSTIRTGIELNDNFSSVLYSVISSVNLAIISMDEMQQTMNADIDTSSLEGARNEINQATMAVNELNSAMGKGGSASVSSPVVNTEAVKPTPVEVPVVWQTDNLDVFTGTGIERFEQEVQSTNSMLEQLSSTQDSIAKQAYNTNVFSPEAFQNLNSLAVRIDTVRNRIQQIESNPLNMGTDAANGELEHLRSQLSQALQEQNRLNSAMDNMDVGGANEAYMRLSQTIGTTERYIRDNVDEQGRFNQEISEGTNEANNLMSAIKSAVSVYAVLKGIGETLNISDEMAQTTARLNMMNDGLQSTQDLQNMIYVAAERSRGAYQDTVATVAKLGNLAGDAFGSSAEIVSFAEQLNKQFTIAGASTDEMKNATLQLTQALGSGVLRGDELNSIFEQAPTIIQSISKYIEGNDDLINKMAKGIGIKAEDLSGNVQGHIRDIAAEGLISADIVKNAMFAAADDTNAKFESMPKTFQQVGQSIQNTALMAFQPVLQRLNDIANSEGFTNFVNDAVNGLAVVANIVLNIFDLVGQVGGFIADNWSMISPIVYGVAGALAVYYGWQMAVNAVELISKGLHYGMAIAQMIQAAATGGLTAATAAEIAAQNGLNTALYACPIVWIIILIIALIAIFYAAVAAVNHFAGTSISATGLIAGAIATAGAFIWNIIVGVVNAIIGIGVELYNLIATFANFFANVFNDPVGAILNLFSGMFDFILGIVQAAAKLIDTVLGSNLAGAVEGFRDDFASAVDDIVGDQTVVMEKANASDYQFDGVDYGDAWDAGYSFGEGIDDKVSNFNPADLFGSTKIPSADDYTSALDSSANLSNISGNTDAIKDSIDVTDEQLKYLRDAAERDVVNRYTTAEIKVDMPVNANINNDMDLDGVVSHLATGVNEAMEKAAEGVHD